jgi:hypothetical protein
LGFTDCKGASSRTHRSFYEPSDLLGAGEQVSPPLPFGRDLLGFEDILGEPGAGTALTFLNVLPASFSRSGLFG